MNFYNHHNSVSFKSHSIRVTFKICMVLGAQGIRATGFRRSQGNQHCTKFESHTNRVTFETNAIIMTSSIQALSSRPQICYSMTTFNHYYIIVEAAFKASKNLYIAIVLYVDTSYSTDFLLVF